MRLAVEVTCGKLIKSTKLTNLIKEEPEQEPKRQEKELEQEQEP